MANLIQNESDPNLKFLFYGEGTDGTDVAIDDIGNSVTTNMGTPPVRYSSTEALWETGSIKFGNSNNLVMTDVATLLDFGTSDFTIDLKFKFTTIPNSFGQYIFCQYNATNSVPDNLVLYFYQDSYGFDVVNFRYRKDNSVEFVIDSYLFLYDLAFDTSNRHGIAVERDGNTIRLYLDNKVIGSTSYSGTIASPTTLNRFEIGCSVYVAGGGSVTRGSYFLGYVGDYRAVIGEARYKGTYNIDADYGSPEIIVIMEHYYNALYTAQKRQISYYNSLVENIHQQPYYSSTPLRIRHISNYAITSTTPLRFEYVIQYGGLILDRLVHYYSSSETVRSLNLSYYSSSIEVRLSNSSYYSSLPSLLIIQEQPYYSTTEVRNRLLQYYEIIADSDRPLLARFVQQYYSFESSVTFTTGTVALVLSNGQTLPIRSASLTADEGSPYWQCQVELAHPRDYLFLELDTPFTLQLFTLSFSFLVDSRELQRSMDAEGNLIETATLSGLSPCCVYNSARAHSITQTWDIPTLASDVVEELIGAITWGIVDWMIPAYRFSITAGVPLEAAKTVIEAAGGYLESLPSGSLQARPQWPVNIPYFATATPDVTLTNRSIFSLSEAPLSLTRVNKIRILDAEASEQDQLEWIASETDWREGTLRAYPSPYRDGLYLRHTRGTVITLSAQSESTENFTEIVEFQNGQASVAHPVEAIINVTWMSEDCGSVTAASYSTQLTASSSGNYQGYSLASITYRSRFLTAPAKSSLATEAQFLLEDTDYDQ